MPYLRGLIFGFLVLVALGVCVCSHVVQNFTKMDQNKEVSDIIAAAQEYLRALKTLENDVRLAEQQIENSARETENNTTLSFSNLLENITNVLQARQKHLLQKTRTVRDKSLKPLRDCRKIIQNKIQATENLVLIGKKVASNKHHPHDVNDVNIDASFLGSLPEVPALNQVPCISYVCESNISKELLDTCSSYGCVSAIAPVQISSLVEKPGSILVEWHCIENEDKLIDIQEFRLQKAYGNVLVDKRLLTNFSDCYLGSDNQYLVKDLPVNQSYSFRVCCKFEGSSTWSPWSLPQVEETSIKSYSWEESGNFCLRNDNKIAKSTSSSKSVLYSEGPQFHVGYCIEFTFVECDPALKDMFVGITYQQNKTSIDSLIADSFLVEANGDIYISGVKKSTKLPEVDVGSKISFTCTQLNDSKILINVDSGEKRVTYDWTLNSDDALYFFAIFTSSKWKIMVE